jgi:hypothetical protein
MKSKLTKVRTTVVALPGWYVASLSGPAADVEGQEFIYEPIIAWEVERVEDEQAISRNVIAITINGDFHELYAGWAYKRPDGIFEIPGGPQYPDEATALREMLRDRAESKHKHHARLMSDERMPTHTQN